jgi:solute carrier family 25 carnitine/acylcarnitine transporter 20/29
MYFKSNPLFGSLVSGGLSGAACWGLTYPLDNIKTRIQSDNLDPKKRKYSNTLDCIRKTKFKDMWKGFTPCVLRAVPVNAAIFFGYTYVRQVMKFD